MLSHIASQTVFKKILLNGLVILVRPVDNIPQVSIQLHYHAGSSSEQSDERGIAHLIEHMIFKGTDILSESDISAVGHKLSGYTNAFTSYDYTGYVFNFPTQHWQEALPILANCMRNCRFEEQMLNSELKAVIQELKMNRDKTFKTLWQAVLTSIFADHPYHYPVIGFKQDLWNLKVESLHSFYRKHYIPNNAVLVVVGDVTPEEVFVEAEKAFGSLKKDETYKRQELYHSKDLISQSTTIYRDIQQPIALLATVLPGLKENKKFLIEVISALLGEGKSSCLQKLLVDELQLVTEFSTSPLALEDATLFMMVFCPKDLDSIDKIHAIIDQKIQELIKNGIPEHDLLRAVKAVKVSMLSILESNYSQATEIAQSYLMTGNENAPFEIPAYELPALEKEIRTFLKTSFQRTMMHDGKIVPLRKEDHEQWKELQLLADQEDARILEGKTRELPVEEKKYAHQVVVKQPKEFHFHKAEKAKLSNGIKTFIFNNPNVPKIEIILSLAAKSYNDPEKEQGIYGFICRMMIEGTKNYPGHLFAQEVETYGMGLSVVPGGISMSVLKEDFEKGLELLKEVLTEATFDKKTMNKVKDGILADIKFFYDDPNSYGGQLIREKMYKGHPYSKNALGTVESVEKITKKDLTHYYKLFFTPDRARVAVVGDLAGYNVSKELEHYLGTWTGPKAVVAEFTPLSEVVAKTESQYMNRDQVVLIFAGRSITRSDADYDKLVLFDQIFCAPGSMSSRLFDLREQSGLFYSIGGSLVAGVDEQPGMVIIKTMVSLDRLEEAKKAITKTMKEVIDTLTEKELEEAKKIIINGQIDSFSSNVRMGSAFLYVDRFNLSDDYFDKRAQVINAITLDQVKEAARKILITEKMITLQVGRVE